MIHARGARQDYDSWAYLGNTGWSRNDVLLVFRRIEDYDHGTSECIARAGWGLAAIHDGRWP